MQVNLEKPASPSTYLWNTDMQNGGKVWIVDDDQSIRWVLERALTQAGIDQQSFSDAESMLKRLGNERPDVVISDIRMPGMNGLELLQQIRSDFADLPVIITTAPWRRRG